MSDLELVGPLYQYECHTCRHMSDCYDTAEERDKAARSHKCNVCKKCGRPDPDEGVQP